MKPLKLRTEGGKWYIKDQKKTVVFDNSKDAWAYITYVMIIRAAIKMNSTIASTNIHPVRSLVPHPIRGL